MPSASRRTIAALVLAGLVVLVGVTLIPTHVSLGAGSLRCGTVWHPDRTSEVARYCGKAGAEQLRASLTVGAFLGCLGLLPMLCGRFSNRRRTVAFGIWIAVFLTGAAMGLLVLALSEYSPRGTVFDL